MPKLFMCVYNGVKVKVKARKLRSWLRRRLDYPVLVIFRDSWGVHVLAGSGAELLEDVEKYFTVG